MANIIDLQLQVLAAELLSGYTLIPLENHKALQFVPYCKVSNRYQSTKTALRRALKTTKAENEPSN